MQPRDIKGIQKAIRAMHGCGSRHVDSIPIYKRFGSKTAWHGNVEIFDLVGCERAKQCYAWQYRDRNEGVRTVILLNLPPVDSPGSAVEAAIAGNGQDKAHS